ncbi:hypothetical protein CEXT_701721 [Caerostris extrusa]|uniref:Uncharacterized protein n=1 Tax=Caerostris extrusa TaxID=172846 RepID=A0AAV4YCE5_CAEEX|nr:hypothetical protein CEXT_701721 [Caerostris extrusa]
MCCVSKLEDPGLKPDKQSEVISIYVKDRLGKSLGQKDFLLKLIKGWGRGYKNPVFPEANLGSVSSNLLRQNVRFND